MDVIELQAQKWVATARKMARGEVGDGWGYLSAPMRAAMVCHKLCGILAGLDESARNPDKMVRAMELAMVEE